MAASPPDNCYGYNFDSIVPHADTALLRCRSAESGYRNVYCHRYRDQKRSDVPRYEGCVKFDGVKFRLKGSRSPHPHVCALHVLCWYRDRFGARWREVLLGRHLRPPAIEATYCEESGGWVVSVWEFGKVVGVRGVRLRGKRRAKYDRPDNVRVRGHQWKRLGRLLVFPTEADALHFADVWLARRWGLVAPFVAWRIADEGKALAA